jgi:hypothetical protein
LKTGKGLLRSVEESTGAVKFVVHEQEVRHRRVCRGYFIDPIVSPRTIKRCPSAISRSAGMVAITEAAAICPCCVSYCCAKRAIATGTVAVSREVRLSAIETHQTLQPGAVHHSSVV